MKFGIVKESSARDKSLHSLMVEFSFGMGAMKVRFFLKAPVMSSIVIRKSTRVAVPSNKWMPRTDTVMQEKYPHVVKLPWKDYATFYDHYVVSESNRIDCLHSYFYNESGPEEEWYFMTIDDAVLFKMLV